MTALRFALLSFALLVCAPARAESLADVFQRGVKAQARGDYAAAVSAYETLIEAGVDDADVSVNLANAYGNLARHGQAIRYFERALKLSPRDDGARAGLARAIEALGAKQARERGEAIVNARPPLLAALFAGVTRETLAIGLWVSAWLAGVCALLLLRPASEAVRITLGIACAAGAVGAAGSWLGLGVKRDFGADGVPALVIVPEAELRQGPDDSAEHAGTLLEGTRVRILDRRAGHVRIRTSNGSEGYAAVGDVGAL